MRTSPRARSSRTVAASAAVLALSAGFLTACGPGGTAAAKGSTITIAVLEDPTRHMAFWALENDKVDLGGVQVKVSYVPTQTAQQAYQSKQYSIVETSPVAVALAATKGLQTRILSAGVQDQDATVVDVPSDSAIKSPKDLKGRTVAISAPTGSSTTQLRYVLDKGYGLQAKEQGGHVKLQVTPPDATLSLMKKGALDAAVELNRPRYIAEHDEKQNAVLHVSKEAAELTGAAPVQTVLITYPELEKSRADELRKVVKAMQESTSYARDHKQQVADSVAKGNAADASYLTWWWSTADLRFGSLGSQDEAGVKAFWTMSQSVGHITSVPQMETFRSSAAPAA
ncbi:ABC transporter substrate-binding protein [Streptomyces sp. NPDC055105]|uniref:ABC transporter substrate-binding protein n=1 Tax=Streptomyces sp. NPDC055105 TaxID=3365719 RepID=UPI0037D0BFEA